MTHRFSDDSVARTLELVGERWSMLIIREVLFGVRRYGQMAKGLGIPRPTLSARLQKLTEAGVLERVPYSPDRHEYRLTKAGHDLYPAVVMLMRWGDQYLCDPEGPPIVLRHDACGEITHPVLRCDVCDEPIVARGVTPEKGPGWAARRAAAAAIGD